MAHDLSAKVHENKRPIVLINKIDRWIRGVEDKTVQVPRALGVGYTAANKNSINARFAEFCASALA